jgi:hypothetical protein
LRRDEICIHEPGLCEAFVFALKTGNLYANDTLVDAGTSTNTVPLLFFE